MAKKVSTVSGIVVFFTGIALLVATFVVALLAFLNPDRVANFSKLIPVPEGDWEGVLKVLGYAVAVALLMVMGSVAGRITAMGIRMLKAQPSSEKDQEG